MTDEEVKQYYIDKYCNDNGYDEECIQQLEDMGYSKSRIVSAIKDINQRTIEKFKLFNISNLTDEEKQPPEFIVENLIPVGLTFISGAPKLRKSFLALQLASAVATGTDFLSFKTRQCSVVYFDLEGSKSRISSRSGKMGIVMPDSLLISNTIENGIADGLIEQLSILINSKKDIRLIILDTYSRARGTFKAYGANAYDSDVQLLAPLQRFAINEGIAILCIHHDKKGSGFCTDTFERLSGTMGISGSCDSVINLIGDGKRFDGKATLEYCPRDVKGGELKLHFDECSCRWLISEQTEQANPFIDWVLDNTPSKGRNNFFSYADAYGGTYNKYSERPSDAIIKAIADTKSKLFEEYNIVVQSGAKCNDNRGIRIFKL